MDFLIYWQTFLRWLMLRCALWLITSRLAHGPQVVVNDDRLGDGENGEDMYPWKRWHVKSDPFGNNTEKAVEFFSPASLTPTSF